MKKIIIMMMVIATVITVGVYAEGFDTPMLEVEILSDGGVGEDGTVFRPVSYRRSVEKGHFPIYEKYMVRGDKGMLFFEHPILETRGTFLFSYFVPKDEEGNMYSPRRVLEIYYKTPDMVDVEQDIPYERCYFDESGTIYIETKDNGKAILIPVVTEGFPTS